jgi:tRNA modification GTPase
MNLSDTIAAIATPLGEGGLAVIRLSGADALSVADKCFVPVGKTSSKASAAASHTIHYGHIERAGKVLDEVLVAVMRAPRTFTREDVVEISCHGGLLVAKTILDLLIESGARLAEPGEFTKRAFLNGRIDLAQAEAVADLIHARTELALSAANEQLAGKLSQRIEQLRDDLVKTLAHIEAHIDFPDEDIAPDTKDQLMRRLERAVEFMDTLLRTANEGQILRRGVRAAIIGRPNAGKSSLLNQLLGHDRAIVSATPGTTRDTIEETANIRGLPVVFIDTAGLRDAGDEIEAEGIRRSRESLAKAELILHVLDSGEPLATSDDALLREFEGKKRIVVCNKSDQLARLILPEEWRAAAVQVSCATGDGLESLKDAIKECLWSGEIKAEMLQVMINSRHQEALKRARESVLRTLDALRSGLTLELTAMELRIAANAVGEIVGKTSTEDLLDSIFSQFCIGK